MNNFIQRAWALRRGWRTGGLLALVAGCSSPDVREDMFTPKPFRPVPAARHRVPTAIQQASFQAPAEPGAQDTPAVAPGPRPLIETSGVATNPPAAATYGVDDLVRLAVTQNPRLARATIAVDAAQGKYVQAGLYPNPDFAFAWDEIGDRTGPGGIITAPRITQPIVTGRKLSLAQAVASREIDQATLDVLTERFSLVGSVRGAFYEVLALQLRQEILRELVQLAEQGVAQGKALVEGRQLARLDLLQLEVELERYRTDAAAVERELPSAYSRLAAIVGQNGMPITNLSGAFEQPPAYDLDQVRETVLATHPEAQSARVGVERAQAAVRLAKVQPIPNLSVYGGFIQQNENRSSDGAFGISAPFPLWNRNQGNIRTAQAELAMAIQTVGQVENSLADRVATSFRTYTAARERAARYRVEILPRAQETFDLSMKAFKGGQFEYLRVIQAQRAVAEARLELNRSLGDAWRAAGELSGLLLEEAWPAAPKDPILEPLFPGPKPVPPAAEPAPPAVMPPAAMPPAVVAPPAVPDAKLRSDSAVHRLQRK